MMHIHLQDIARILEPCHNGLMCQRSMSTLRNAGKLSEGRGVHRDTCITGLCFIYTVELENATYKCKLSSILFALDLDLKIIYLQYTKVLRYPCPEAGVRK